MTPVFRLTTCTLSSFLADGIHDWLTILAPSFLFGNFAIDNTFYVLSLPSFKWHATGIVSSPGRTEMTCTPTKNRQAIIIGGTNTDQASYPDPQNWEAQDPWTKGINVFDMTTLNFTEMYDAHAPPYEASTLVRNSYNSRFLAFFQEIGVPVLIPFSQRFPVWDDPALELIFNTTAHDGSSHLSAGVISGIVVGAVVGATLLGSFIAWRLFKRRRRAASGTQTNQRFLETACPSNHLQVLKSENPPDPPPVYTKETPRETPDHAEQDEMAERPGDSERLHSRDWSEVWDQTTYDKDQTEMPLQETGGLSHRSFSVMITPDITGSDMNQP